MKRVLTYGTYDVFHYGHLRLLERIKELGDYLIVGVSTDEFDQIKNKKSSYPFEHRSAIVNAIKYVDLVIAEQSWDQKASDIESYDIDVFVMGDDWAGKFDHLKTLCEVIYLPRTPNISSSKIKQAHREGGHLSS